MKDDYYININNQSYKYIEQWIQFITYNKKKNKNETYKKNLLITGPCGIGKTIYVHYLLKKYNYTIFEFNLIDFKQSDYIKEQFKNILECRDITSLFTNKKQNKIVIINQLDQFNTTEKNILQNVINYIINNNISDKKRKKNKKVKQTNKKNKDIIPIIFMSNTYKTFFKSFLKYSMRLVFPLPSEYDMSLFSKYYIKKKNIDISEINLIRIQNDFPPNYKSIINILDLIQVYMRVHNKFNLIPIRQIILNNKSDLDIDIYQSSYNLLTEPLTFNEAGYIMSKDTKYISLLLHKNFMFFLHHNTNDTYSNKLKQLLYFNSYVNFFSIILDSYLHTNNDIFLYQYVNYTLSKCCNIMLHNKQTTLQYSSYNQILKSPVISKLNYKYCNIKYIHEICKRLHINDYSFQIFAHYLYYLFTKHKVKKYKNILLAIINHYNLKYKEIDKIFKLMYIQKTKTKILDYEDVYKHLYK